MHNEQSHIQVLLQHLIDCDEVARRLGKPGLCDVVGADGLPKQSAALTGQLQIASMLRIEPQAWARQRIRPVELVA